LSTGNFLKRQSDESAYSQVVMTFHSARPTRQPYEENTPAGPTVGENPAAEATPAAHDITLDRAIARARRRLVPFLLLMYVISFLDRANIGFAKQALQQYAGISSRAYALAAGLFFISYALFELPSNLILHRIGAKVWMARIMVTWGVVSMATMLVVGSRSFYVLRLLLGVAEAGFFPGVILYLTYWFPSRVRAEIFGLFYLGAPLAFIFGGPVSGLLLQMHSIGSLQGWQCMFLAEGGLAVLVGVWAYWFLDNRPSEADWLSSEEKDALASALVGEETRRDARHSTTILTVLKDTRMLQFVGIYFLIQMSVYGVVFYLPSEIGEILRKPTGIEVGIVSSIPWVCALAGTLWLPRLATRLKQNAFIAAMILLAAGIASCLFPLLGPRASFAALCIAATGFIAVQPLFWTFPASYLSDKTAAGGLAIINAIGAFGGFVAPNIKAWADIYFRSQRAGLFVLAAATLLSAGMIAVLGRENHREIVV
jgi:MFS family permease